MKVSVVIATHNRASELRNTLRSLAGVVCEQSWEIVVVDNNSTDDTRAVVTVMQQALPVECRYVVEKEQGRYAAMNTGIDAAKGEIIASTDDDARLEADWLERGLAGLERFGCDYVGGKVLPIWGAPRPKWLPDGGGIMWSPVALLDFGAEPLEFGRNGATWPLGINLAIRRDAFRLVGGYDNRLGRKAGTLRNQAQREWHIRARQAGLRGYYLPDMVAHHVVPPERLQKRYFRRWLYWHGISRAILYDVARLDMQDPDYSTIDFSSVPHVLGVPRYMFRSVFLRSLAGTVKGRVRGDVVMAFENELWLWFFGGVVRQRFRDRRRDKRLARK